MGLRKRYTGATGIEHQQFDRRVARTAAMFDAHHFGQRIALAQCAGGTTLTGFDQQFAGEDIRRVGYGVGVPRQLGIGRDVEAYQGQLWCARRVSRVRRAVP